MPRGVQPLRRLTSPDGGIFAVDYYDKFGYDRPMYFLGHDILFAGPAAEFMERCGIIRATDEHAVKALAAGGVVMVYPGGDYDVYRPTMRENVIGFAGRTGYVTAAIEAAAPIVPSVSIGAQENQLYLTRGRWLVRVLHLTKLEHKIGRTEMLPIAFGFPFGFNIFVPVNMPLPTKIVTEVLKPIDVIAEFGENPDVHEVDAHVRSVMQTALDRLAHQRRFPIFG